MAKTYYTSEHEWIRVEGDTGTVGITDHAQQQLGDIVFVDLKHVGLELAQGDEAAVVESVKAASEVYAPVSGEIVEINDLLADNSGLVNEDAEGKAWFVKIRLADKSELDELMDKDAYDAFCASEA
jgi:glycine cleavage system H protein